MEARLALLFREVLEKCGTMSANAFVAVELTSGERLWAANGPFKEEFRNQVGVRHCMCVRASAVCFYLCLRGVDRGDGHRVPYRVLYVGIVDCLVIEQR